MKTAFEPYPWLNRHWSFFQQRFEMGRLAHALLIAGPQDCGKLTLAKAMVVKLLCCEDLTEACGKCRSCVLLTGGAHPDYFELQPQEGSDMIKVDQVRELIGKLDLTTSVSPRKVACIHPSENMNGAAANALLKSLEEPAGDTVLVLVSNNPGRLPVTIRSRCQTMSINQPEAALVHEWLKARTEKSADNIAAAVEAAGGSPLRALRYLDTPETDEYSKIREGLAMLLARPAAVSLISSELNQLEPSELWRWLSMCTAELAKARMMGQTLPWFPALNQLHNKTLLQLQRQSDINRQLSETPVRGDLLLQDWLIRWSEQVIR